MKEVIDSHIKSHLERLCCHWGAAMRTNNLCVGQGYRCTLDTSVSDGTSDCIDNKVEHVCKIMRRLKNHERKINRELYAIADKLYIEQKTIAELAAQGCTKKTIYNRQDSLISHLYIAHYLPWIEIKEVYAFPTA